MKKLVFALAAAVFAACGAAKSGSGNQPADMVDPLIGTADHGHTYPGATAPFGGVQLSPDTRNAGWDACSGYHHTDSTIIGFAHTHLSGTGCADLADILFHPTAQEPTLVKEGYIFTPKPFSHADETATPGYYAVTFKDGVKAEMTAGMWTGMHRYTFPKDAEQIIIIDLKHAIDGKWADAVALHQTAANEIAGLKRTQGWVRNNYTFFVAQFSQDPVSVDYICDGEKVEMGKYASNNIQAVVRFGKSTGEPLVAQVGISKVSNDNARTNIVADVAEKGFDFDALRAATREKWNTELAKITVEGGTPEQMRTFYTAAYHTMVVPNRMSDANGQYRRHDMEIATAPEGRNYVSTLSLWDTFRAWNPLMTLTNGDVTNNAVWSMLEMYKATGELPIWPLASGETWCMIGYHSMPVITDAWLAGQRAVDGNEALAAMVESSNKTHRGLESYNKLGYIAKDLNGESVSSTLEYAFDDWCIAQMARAMGNDSLAMVYEKRSLNYQNLYDASTGFFRPRMADGSWEEPFDPYVQTSAYTEATPWQFRFFVPHDVQGLANLMGGREKMAEALDALFNTTAPMTAYNPDISGIIGQYAHGNEPSHHMAYLYNWVGQPWKTQAMTRRILAEQYNDTPTGISGNEDCGQMSAWYVLTSLGFYAVAPGSGQYALTTPLFPRAVMNLANGKTLEITANDPANNVYIDRVELNGVPIEVNYITREQIMGGGVLNFVLRADPNTERGTAPEAAPYSLSEEIEG